MIDHKEQVLTALQAMRAARDGIRRRRAGIQQNDMQPIPVDETFNAIKSTLSELGLFNESSLVLIARDGVRVALDATGQIVSAKFFNNVDAPLAVFSSGPFTRQYAALQRPLRASTDDMAQLFGAGVACVHRPDRTAPALIIANCGFVVTGRYLSELFAAAILVEKSCRAEMLALRVGSIQYLPRTLSAAERVAYLASYSKGEVKANMDEAHGESTPTIEHFLSQELREEVIHYGKLLVEHQLIRATWGNVSVRLDDDHFLITPSGVNYERISPIDIACVRISDGSYEKGQHPSSERTLHRLVYQERPDIRAIIHTHSANCAVFAACHVDLLTETLDYPCAPYAVSSSASLARNVANVMMAHDGCIMANHGFVTGAPTLEQALSQALEAEEAAGKVLGA